MGVFVAGIVCSNLFKFTFANSTYLLLIYMIIQTRGSFHFFFIKLGLFVYVSVFIQVFVYDFEKSFWLDLEFDQVTVLIISY